MIEHVIVHVIANRPEHPRDVAPNTRPFAAQIRNGVRSAMRLMTRAWKPRHSTGTSAESMSPDADKLLTRASQ